MIRIVADIGNTVCKLARMDGCNVESLQRLTHNELNDAAALDKAFQALIEGSSPPGDVVVCSVVPASYRALEEYCGAKGLAMQTVIPEDLPEFTISYATVDTLGADRYCTALGAAALAGAPCIAIDMGTATTVNVVNEEHCFVGGAISPGLRTGYKALHAYTAQLPSLEPQWPGSYAGTTTEESIHVGASVIHVLGLKALIERIAAGFSGQPAVYFTGGNMQIIPQKEFNGAVFEPHMVLIGAAMYAEAKKRKKLLKL